MLEKMGYQASWVRSGLDVIEVMETKDFDVIIMDLQMPDMDGLTATQYIRTSFPKRRQPQIIALTADSRQETLEASLETGVDLFLTKPIRKNILEQFLEQIKRGENIKPEMSQKTLDNIKSGKSTNDSIDDSILNDLIETLGNDDKNNLIDLINTFLINTPPIVEDIQLSAERGDFESYARKAHALKGNCELFGASRLADLCKEAETLAREGKRKDLIKTAKTIEIEYQQVKMVLEEKKSTSK
jgi:CheY-like chemotaxis protein